jgi:hypothetical protein
MDKLEEIKKLKEQIKALEKEKEEKEAETLAKYKYLKGKFLHRPYTSFEKVTNVYAVDKDTFGNIKVEYECIKVFIYEDSSDKQFFINNNEYGDIDIEDLERCEITEKQFLEAFEKAVEYLRAEI